MGIKVIISGLEDENEKIKNQYYLLKSYCLNWLLFYLRTEVQIKLNPAKNPKQSKIYLAANARRRILLNNNKKVKGTNKSLLDQIYDAIVMNLRNRYSEMRMEEKPDEDSKPKEDDYTITQATELWKYCIGVIYYLDQGRLVNVKEVRDTYNSPNRPVEARRLFKETVTFYQKN